MHTSKLNERQDMMCSIENLFSLRYDFMHASRVGSKSTATPKVIVIFYNQCFLKLFLKPQTQGSHREVEEQA